MKRLAVRLLLGVVATLMVAGSGPEALAQDTTADGISPHMPPDGPPGLWDPSWRKSDWYDGTTTLVLGGAALSMQLFVKQPDTPRWVGPILFDTPFRDLFASSTRAGRDDASAISNIFWYTSMAYPLADTLITALAVHQDPEAAWEMFAMTTQAFASAGFVNALLISTVSRGRPLFDKCADEPEYSSLCRSMEKSRSFPSGHAAFAFTGAGLTCAFHGEMELYGDGPWGTVACIGTLASATATGLLRMVADRHWITDVLVGGGLGFAAGYLLPNLLHFDYNDDGANVVVTPWSDGEALGLGMSGTL